MKQKRVAYGRWLPYNRELLNTRLLTVQQTVDLVCFVKVNEWNLQTVTNFMVKVTKDRTQWNQWCR